MDEIKPITNQGFFSYVFKLSKFKQADLLNFIQYCILSINRITFDGRGKWIFWTGFDIEASANIFTN